MVFGTAQKYTRQKCGSEISELCFPSAHMLLFETKGKALSNVSRWKMLLRNRKHLGWCMVARRGRAWNEYGFLLFADFKLVIQRLVLELKAHPCSATAPHKDRLVHGLASGLSFPHQCLGN